MHSLGKKCYNEKWMLYVLSQATAHPLIKNTPYFLQNNIQVWLDHFCSRLSNINQSWVGEGVTVIANLWCRHPVGEKVPNS